MTPLTPHTDRSKPQRGRRPVRMLAVCSGGGHWIQMMRLRPAFAGADVRYLTVDRRFIGDVHDARVYLVNDANEDRKIALLAQLVRTLVVMLRVRPEVVVSTGASVGYFALRIGKLLGARTIWIDSIANVEQLSKSGRLARSCADLWLTQWEHLAAPGGPHHYGSVLG